MGRVAHIVAIGPSMISAGPHWPPQGRKTAAATDRYSPEVIEAKPPRKTQPFNQSINQFIEQKDRSATYIDMH